MTGASRFPPGKGRARTRRAYGGVQAVESGETSPVTSFNTRTGTVTLTSADVHGVLLAGANITLTDNGTDVTIDGTHTHVIADITGLQTALDGKASLSHTHAIADVTNLQTTLDGKAALVHTHAIADVTNLQTSLDGKVDDSQISAFGLTLVDDIDAATARTTLGLGSISTQASSSVNITGGVVSGVSNGLQVISGANHTLALSNAGNSISIVGSGPLTVTVPADATINHAIGTRIRLYHWSTTTLTVAREAGVELYFYNGTGAPGNADRSLAVGAYCDFIKHASNQWFITGVGIT